MFIAIVTANPCIVTMNYGPKPTTMNPLNTSRRNFIKNASIGTIATLALPQIVSAAFAKEAAKKVSLDKDDIVLFQGDSITDWGRDHNKSLPNNTVCVRIGLCIVDRRASFVKTSR